MTGLGALIKRDIKLFFRDKGMFFTALITPMILLVLYVTFLGNVYKDSFLSAIPQGFDIPEKLIDGLVAGQLLSSLLAVCCVTVSFCSNLLMVQDKVTGARTDITVTPVKSTTMALAYYLSTSVITLLICYIATGAGLLYVGKMGWYLSRTDVVLLLLDVFILVMFGTALSSIINYFLSTQGQISAVGSIISSVYGFICGAYMPISNFSEGLQKVLSFLPGTYATALLRNHSMQGVFDEMTELGLPGEFITAMQDTVDCNIYFFDDKVPMDIMYIFVGGATLALILVYVAMNLIKVKRKK